jgi:hypothetical protein
MTYSLHLSVDLCHLTEESRQLARMSDLGTVHRAKPPSSSVRRDKPRRGSIAFELKVPDDLAGKHAEYGTSVFAAGRGGLELVRTQLAQAGIEREELDQLTTANVSIEQAAATYVFKFTGKKQTTAFISAMHHHALLLGLPIKYDRQANTVSYNGVVTQATSEAFDVVLTVLRQPDRGMVRIEVSLDSHYLQTHGWTSLESWRSAYAEGRYAAIFNQAVRGLFQLDSSSLPYGEPGREVLDKLPPTTEGLLREYFDGRDPLWYGRHAVASSEAKRKRLVKGYRDVILGITGIDIVFPWQQFRWMAPAFLKSKLIYPGDLEPTGSQISVCFFGANWPQLLATLRKKYRAVLLTRTSR